MPPSASSNPRSTSSRCKLCNNLDPKGLSFTFYDPESSFCSATINVDPLGLAKVSHNGCRFCRVLIQALDGLVSGWRKAREPLRVDLASGKPIRITVPEVGEKKYVELYCPKDRRSPWPGLGFSHHIPSDAASEKSFGFARKCVEDCISSPRHKLCKAPSVYAPSRLIYVGDDEGDPIRLCELNAEHAVSYVALSHCWGGGIPLTTTSDSIHEYRDQIAWKSLPKLFQDAVTITRGLGVRFLWIDALCIVQDSKEDWEHESSGMRDLYEGAYVTIAATSAPNSSQSIFSPRSKKLKVRYQNTAKKEFILVARETTEAHFPLGESDEPVTLHGPLMKRAWCLQEHVLSSRVLHYTGFEIIFECRTDLRCECEPSPQAVATVPSKISKLCATKKKWRPYEVWHDLVAKYVRRNMTKPSDKLPAISGIATKLQAVMNSEYLAGLWLKNLLDDLLWSSRPYLARPNRAPRFDFYRAPTFSWASVDTEIEFEPAGEPGAKSRPLAEYVEHSMQLQGLNRLGEVTDGSLTLRGPLIHARLKAFNQNDFYYYLETPASPNQISVYPDTLLVESSASGPRKGTDQTTLVRASAQPGCGFSPFDCAVVCLAIMATVDGYTKALVLGLSPRKSGYYERLGLACCAQSVFSKAKKETIKMV
jgi:Heterokaryon incompatibility protein (HET)